MVCTKCGGEGHNVRTCPMLDDRERGKRQRPAEKEPATSMECILITYAPSSHAGICGGSHADTVVMPLETLQRAQPLLFNLVTARLKQRNHLSPLGLTKLYWYTHGEEFIDSLESLYANVPDTSGTTTWCGDYNFGCANLAHDALTRWHNDLKCVDAITHFLNSSTLIDKHCVTSFRRPSSLVATLVCPMEPRLLIEMVKIGAHVMTHAETETIVIVKSKTEQCRLPTASNCIILQPRPRGPAPKGKEWNSRMGRWEAMHVEQA